jgi:hypothetical protein
MQQERRINQTAPLDPRLIEEAQRLRKEARGTHPGIERERLLRRARQHALAAVAIDDALVVDEIGRGLGQRARRDAGGDGLLFQVSEEAVEAGAVVAGGGAVQASRAFHHSNRSCATLRRKGFNLFQRHRSKIGIGSRSLHPALATGEGYRFVLCRYGKDRR